MTGRAGVTAAEVDRVVIGVHRAIDEQARTRIRNAAQAAGLESIAHFADLGEFMTEGRLSDEVVLARFRYSVGPATAAIATLRDMELIDAAGRPATQLAGLLAEGDSVRLATAARLWGESAHLETLAAGAAVMLRHARGPLVEPYRALNEPADPVGALWHRLVGLRYARADAHAAAWEEAGFTAAEMPDLTTAWRGEAVNSPQQSLVDRGVVSESGAITEAGTEIRDAIEADTNRRSEPVYRSLDGWTGWMAAMAELSP